MRHSIQSRVLNVLMAVELVRELHPELKAPAKPRAIWRALENERIQLRRGRIRRKGRASAFDGDAVITLRADLSAREAWKWALHEYGHVRMHFPATGEHEKHLAACHVSDPREDEATLFALLLYLGPAATPETPEVAGLVAKMVTRDHRRRALEQLPLSLPEPAPVYKPLPEPFQTEREYQRTLGRRGGRRARLVRDDPSAGDLDRIKFYDAARGTARFADVAGRLWWVYNYRVTVDGAGKQRLELVRDFMSPEIRYRIFVNSAGERRAYRFGDRREQRAYRVKHLDRQLDRSSSVANRKTLNVRTIITTKGRAR